MTRNSKNTSNAWRNRIVGYSEEEPDQLLANPSNWRIHPAAQQNALSGVLKEIGLVQNVVANRTTGHLVDGHLRVMLAMREGQSAIPVTWVELSEDEELLILASIDPLSAMATADAGALDALLSSVQSGDAAVTAMLASLAESAGIYPPKDDADAEPQIDRAEELRVKWGVETGQIWRLSSRTEGQEHRLICGDSTNADVVQRLLRGEVPLLMVTDPPYGVEYDPEWRVEAGYSERTHGHKLLNDDTASWERAYRLFPGDIVYVWHASSMTHVVAKDLIDCGFEEKAYVIVWNKDFAVFGRGDYHWKHEHCRYSWRKGKTHHYIGGKKQTTVWDIPTIHSFANGHTVEEWGLVGHGTQKPLECMARPIRNHDSPLVYDPFSGSGTTIIAAENLGRQARAVEISPAYVAVALQRYSDAFGITPELID